MKTRLGPSPMIFPMPAVLVSTLNDDGTPNAMTAAWAAACCHSPPCLGVAVRSSRLTYANIERTSEFVINVPRTDAAEVVDYLGIVSGVKQPDKLEFLKIDTEPGAEVEAPILMSCPINAECKVVGEIELGTHTWFVGQVVQVNADSDLVSEDGKVDVKALDPLAYATSTGNYHSLGGPLGKSYSIGKRLKSL